MNIANTNFVLIGKNQHVDIVHTFVILGDSEVTQSSIVKFLGSTVDESLDLHAHISQRKLKLTLSFFRLHK